MSARIDTRRTPLSLLLVAVIIGTLVPQTGYGGFDGLDIVASGYILIMTLVNLLLWRRGFGMDGACLLLATAPAMAECIGSSPLS